MSTKTIRVMILDDHQTIIDGYRFRLGNSSRVEVVAAISYGEALQATLEKYPTDVLLLDVTVPVSADNPNPYPILHVIPALLQQYPDLTILVISMHVQRSLIRAVMEAGASGYILKDDQATLRDLENVVVSVSSGGIYLSRQANDALLSSAVKEETLLSKRQLEALSLCLSYPDYSTAELAQKMSISHSTVRNLLSGAYLKLGVRSRLAGVDKARQLGLISPLSATVPAPKR
ncbi:MAG TPA: response regulator transcription factor [Anaerolineales bacterium]|nr:response regulator transcription factor [Anaerolineales bacterium]